MEEFVSKKLVLKRERLYQAIWKEPIENLAQNLNISETKLKEICKYLNIPIPNKKYWTALRTGKNPEIEKLPKECEQEEYIEVINTWEENRKKELKCDSLGDYKEEERNKIRKICKDIKLENRIEKMHPLVLERNSMKQEQNTLNMYEAKESKEIKKRIDAIYHTIFTTIEKLGYEVGKKQEKYFVTIQEESIFFKIREKTKIEFREPLETDNQYQIQYVKGKPKVKEIKPSGRLELKIDYYGKKNVWQDTNNTVIEDVIGKIIIELFYCAMKQKQGNRQREEERKQYEKEKREKAQKEFLFRPQELNILFEIGKKVSKIELGMSGSKIRTYILEDIIEKMILHIGSFQKIVRNPNIKELDISILATIARNVMECSNAYFYYAERKIEDEEIELRYHISNLHYDNSMIDIIKKLKYPENNNRTTMLYFGKELTIKSIKKSSIYRKLSKNERSKILNGNQAYLNKRQKELHTVLEENLESAIYNIFSNSTHSYYIGLGNNSMNGSIAHTGYITPEMLLSLATEISIIYIATVLLDYLKLRTKLNQYVTKQEKDFIKQMTSTEKLQEWLEEKRKDYESSFFDMKLDFREEEITI